MTWEAILRLQFPLVCSHMASGSFGDAGRPRRLLLRLTFYCVGITVIALPIYIYFAVVAGKDLLQDLIIFPLTDFRFSRPEHYPGLFELNLYGKSFLKAVADLFSYLSFALPLALFLCGLVALGMAVRRRQTGVRCSLELLLLSLICCTMPRPTSRSIPTLYRCHFMVPCRV